MAFDIIDFDAELTLAMDELKSNSMIDLFFKVDHYPTFKLNGRFIQRMRMGGTISEEEMYLIVSTILTDYDKEVTNKINTFDFIYTILGVGRFRLYIYQEMGDRKYWVIVARPIPTFIKSLSGLNFPEIMKDFVARPGLTLITGGTGMGKTTAIAAILREIYHTRRGHNVHVVTFENLIEFKYSQFYDSEVIVTQLEKGTNFESYHKAIKSALRSSPDIFVVGEIADGKVLEAILEAVERGINVIAAIEAQSVILALKKCFSFFQALKKII